MRLATPPLSAALVLATALLALVGGRAAEAACPGVPYPPGIDPGGPTEVVATLRVGPDGRVVGAEAWEGLPAFVGAVQATLGACSLPAGEVIRYRWAFPAAPVSLIVQVRQGGSQAPLSGVRVQVADRLVSSDDQGTATFRNLLPGEVAITLADPRWRPLGTATVAVEPRTTAELTLWVAPRSRPDELVGRYQSRRPTAVVRTLRLDDAAGRPGTLGDPLRMLAGEAGLARSPYDAGWLLVRGGDFDEVGLFLDGVRIPLVYHLGGFTSVLHPEMIEAVNFWPGAFPARYGAATSGAVDLVPRRIGDRLRAVGGVNLVFAHAFAEAPLAGGEGGIALAARRSYLDGLLSLAVGEEGAEIAPRFWDVQARLDLGKHSLTVLSFADRASAPSVSSVQAGPNTVALVEITQRATQIQGRLHLGKGTDLRAWLAWTRRALTGAIDDQQIDELYPGFRLEHRGRLGEGGGYVGLEGQRRAFGATRELQVRQAVAWTLDPYAGLSMGDPVTVWSEARLETLFTGEHQPRAAPSVRGGLRWRPHPLLEVYTEAAHLHQPPPLELLLGLSEGVYLDLERASQASAGLTLGRRGLKVDVAAFQRRSEGLGGIELDGSVGLGAGSAWGLETSLLARVGQLEAAVVYQYVRSLRTEDGRTAPARPWSFDQPHRLEVRLSQDLPRDWTLGARFRYGSGFPRLLAEGVYLPVQAYDILLQQQVPLGLPAAQERLRPFHSLDLRVARTVTFRKWRLQAFLDVQNVYNRRVVEPVITGFGESLPSYGFGLPILPIFGVEGEFWPGRPD